MAWRIHEHVLRGEIDNRTRDRVTGQVWLAGVEQPLVLDLKGNCHPDLAGCQLTFENPSPVPMTTAPPALSQRGTAGDITAARKVRVFDIPVVEAYMMLKAGGTPPEHLANCLYLEWFAEFSGRILIESADYVLKISEPVWRFTAEELAERERRTAESGSKAFAIEVSADGEEEWDEFRCEQFLRESDARSEKYRRLIEQYGDHPDSENIIAHEMGWTLPDGAVDAEKAAPEGEFPETVGGEIGDGLDDDELEDRLDPAREGIDWVRDDEERIVHPIQKRAKTVLYALFEELRAGGFFPDCEDEALEDFLGHFTAVTSKLAGALVGIVHGRMFMESGLVIAQLKRILEILHQTLTAADRLAHKPFLTAERLDHYRTALFGVREDILALIARLREEG